MVTQSPFLSLPGFRYEDLQGEAAKVQASALSEGTKRNYRSIWSLYDKFTRFYDLEPFPATPETLSSFITLVGFSVKSHKTVYNYDSALRKLHDLSSFDSAAFDDIRVKLTLKGLEKVKRHIPLRKLPITPDMLLKFRSHLDFRNSSHLALWAALLVGFFTFFRTANLCPPSKETFCSFSTLSRNNITFTSWGAQLQSRGPKQDNPGTQLWSFQSLVFQTPIFALSRPYKRYFKQSTFPPALLLSHTFQRDNSLTA